MKKNDDLYLQHMLEAIEDILQFTAAGKDVFDKDKKTRYAVIRCFEILGEAAKQVSTSTRDQQSEISWKDIAGFRDILIHHYHGVNLDKVWSTVLLLPELKQKIKSCLKK